MLSESCLILAKRCRNSLAIYNYLYGHNRSLNRLLCIRTQGNYEKILPVVPHWLKTVTGEKIPICGQSQLNLGSVVLPQEFSIADIHDGWFWASISSRNMTASELEERFSDSWNPAEERRGSMGLCYKAIVTEISSSSFCIMLGTNGEDLSSWWYTSGTDTSGFPRGTAILVQVNIPHLPKIEDWQGA